MSSTNRHDFSRLSKLFGMMGSDSEDEAISALRMVRAEMARQGVTWAQICRAIDDDDNWPGPRRTEASAGFWRQQGEAPKRPAPRAHRHYDVGQRSATKNGLKARDVILYADTMRHKLDQWQGSIIDTWKAIGPGIALTESEWSILMQISARLGVSAKIKAKAG